MPNSSPMAVRVGARDQNRSLMTNFSRSGNVSTRWNRFSLSGRKVVERLDYEAAGKRLAIQGRPRQKPRSGHFALGVLLAGEVDEDVNPGSELGGLMMFFDTRRGVRWWNLLSANVVELGGLDPCLRCRRDRFIDILEASTDKGAAVVDPH